MGEILTRSMDLFLLACVEERLALKRGALQDAPEVRSAVAEALAANDLSDAERDAARTIPPMGAANAISDSLMGARVERAIAAGLKAAAKSGRVPADAQAPRVVVLRQPSAPGKSSTGRESIERTLTATLAAAPTIEPPAATLSSEPARASSPRETLVLADGPSFQELRRISEERPDMKAKWSLSFAGGEKKAPAESSSPATASVRVQELPMTIVAVAETLSVAAHREGFSTAGTRSEPGDGPKLLGKLLSGKYRIDRLIARGGFGAVYEATDEKLGTRVAIKVLTAQAGTATEATTFREEAQRITKINHENVVDWKVFDQTAEGLWYFVMELLQGESLEALLEREGKMPWKRASRILLQVLDALRAAHNLGEGESILHLDLKPNNVFLIAKKSPTERDRIKVFDFGIGQHVKRDDVPAPVESAPSAGVKMPTTKAASAGRARSESAPAAAIHRCQGLTPEYASPEQCAHLIPDVPIVELDGRSDLYSLGVMAFQMLTGRYPHDPPPPENRRDWLKIHREVAPKRVREVNSKVPRRLAHFVDKCLAMDRELRWKDADAAFHELDQIVNPPAWKVVAPIAVPALVVVGVGVWLLGPSPEPPAFEMSGRSTHDGKEVASLANATVYLGPQRNTVTFRAHDAARSSGTSAVALAKVGEKGDVALSGWNPPAWASDDEIRLEAPAVSGRSEDTVRLKLSGGRGKARPSFPFNLVYLGPDAWHIENVAIEGLANASLPIDPRSQPLRIAVQGTDLKATDIDTVKFAVGKKEVDALGIADAKPGLFEWGLTLDKLDPPNGDVHVIARVTDKAGRLEEKDLKIVVENQLLEFDPNALSLWVPKGASGTLDKCGLDSDGSFVFYPGSKPQVHLKLDRRADLSWRVLEPDGTSLGDGKLDSAGAGDVAIPMANLPDLKRGSPYTARIEIVANEGKYVSHRAPVDGSVTREVRISYRTDKPSFKARLSGADSDLEAGKTAFCNSATPSLQVTRDGMVFIWVHASVARQGDPAGAVALPPQLLNSRALSSAQIPLPLPVDGVYEVEVQCGRDKADIADQTDKYTVVRDTRPKRLELKADAQGPLVLPKDGETPRAKLDVVMEGDAAALPVTTPIKLNWVVVHTGTSDVEDATGSTLLASLDSYTTQSIQVPRPKKSGAAGDGTYELRVSGNDDAGNTVAAGSLQFVVADALPEIEVPRPVEEKKWLPAGGPTRFPIDVATTDWNGVREVRCTVTAAEGQGVRSKDVTLKGDDPSGGRIAWTGAFDFDYTWSEKTVDVTIEAVPTVGASATKKVRCRLDHIEPDWPLAAEARFGDGRADRVRPMRFVRGNRGSDYTFGGRALSDEVDRFQKARMYPYDIEETSEGSNPMKSWKLVFADGDIQNFYLDDSEVTCGEYLAFVRAADGYRTAGWWPNGLPDGAEDRRANLEAALATLPADRPVTDVDWEEATAYAKWVGKRLPTWLEWEYAVRGGIQYRPYSWYVDDARAAAQARDRAAAKPQKDPGPASESRDETSDTKIRDLCSNVAEWTSTPVFFIRDGDAQPSGSLKDHASAHRAECLDPSACSRSPEYWAVGGTFDDVTRYDFSVVGQYGRKQKYSNIGFRCAASAQQVLDSIGGGSRVHVRFHRLEK